jgi:hypothetical protein
MCLSGLDGKMYEEKGSIIQCGLVCPPSDCSVTYELYPFSRMEYTIKVIRAIELNTRVSRRCARDWRPIATVQILRW